MSADPSLGGAERRRRPRRLSLLVALALFLGVVGAGAWGANYYRRCQEAADGPRRPVTVTVPEGATGEEVIDDLHARGVIPCGGFVGNILLRGTGKADRIRTGSFDLTTGMTLEAALTVLTTPPPKVPTVELVLPEGLRLTQIAEKVHEDLGIPTARFLKEVQSGRYVLPPYLPAGTASPEGFLFPKSYEFVKKDLSARLVAQQLLEQFRTEAEALPFDRVEELGVTPYELVIIASMIEEEAGVDRDRRLIAGVIFNRLDIGMSLGIDATLLYDDPTPDGQLSSADLAHDSPYNTRINAGLPPTPIASPGVKSLRAALDPADTPFLYYVLCGADGHHKFALTNAEHVRNVDECLG
ncbi:MAG TPA: endolytic transglycosylase MltG [Actinomycetota bacterium]|nr:endolytic transglycosylase MltG [Actinomycetota bacterium]